MSQAARDHDLLIYPYLAHRTRENAVETYTVKDNGISEIKICRVQAYAKQ
jgi:hypothetical protein